MIQTPEKISVIIPVYNVEAYLSKCIESVLTQSYNNLEIILIDDGSIDLSGDICDHMAEKDTRIKVIHQQNQGLSMARNNGIDIASGEYIAFVDSDDWIEKDMYKILYDNITFYNADLSICKYNNIYEYEKNNSDNIIDDYTIVIEREKLLKLIICSGINNYEDTEESTQVSDVVWTKLYKRNLFKKIRFPANKYYEDVYTTYLLLEGANTAVLSSKRMYNYLHRSTSIQRQKLTVKHFDLFDSNIVRYNYIKTKYPNLESICRRAMFYSVIMVLYKVLESNDANNYYTEINNMVNRIKEYNIYNCGLLNGEIKLFELLFKNIKKGIVAMKISINSGIRKQ